jgi:hypothetical protein
MARMDVALLIRDAQHEFRATRLDQTKLCHQAPFLFARGL